MSFKKYLDYGGVRYLWSKVNDKMDSFSDETCIITLESNQGGDVTATVTVTVNGKSTEYQYNSPITLKIPSQSTYSISLGSVARHTTPSVASSYMAMGGSTRRLTFTYKACKLTFNMNPNSGKATVTNSAAGTTDTVTNGSTILVPYNKDTNIVPVAIDGYITPSSISSTKYTQDTTISLTWQEIKLGVFIRTKTGVLYTKDEFTGSLNDVDCIAIYSEAYNMGIAPEFLINPDASSDNPEKWEWYMNSRGKSVYLSGVERTSLGSSGWTYSGANNTTQWIYGMSGYGGEPIFEAARDYIFNNGQHGHIMSIKEAWLLGANITEVGDIMYKLRGSTGNRLFDFPTFNSLGICDTYDEYVFVALSTFVDDRTDGQYCNLRMRIAHDPYVLFNAYGVQENPHTDEYPLVIWPVCNLDNI